MASRLFKRRAIWVALVVVVLVTVGAGTFFLQSRGAAAAERCRVTTEYLTQRGGAFHIDAGERRVFVLGDSYTSGDVLTDREDSWVYDFARLGHLDVTADGIGGTGFVNPGSCGTHAFDTRMTRATDAKPDLVIVQGGLNDWKESPEAVGAAAYNVLQRLADVPEVVVVGPANAPSRTEGARAVDSALREVVEAQGRKYVSAIGWELPYLPDRLHLTPAGHDTFAAHVVAALP